MTNSSNIPILFKPKGYLPLPAMRVLLLSELEFASWSFASNTVPSWSALPLHLLLFSFTISLRCWHWCCFPLILKSSFHIYSS